MTFLMLYRLVPVAGYRKITVDCRESTLCDVSLATVLRLLLVACHIEAKRVAFDRRISRGGIMQVARLARRARRLPIALAGCTSTLVGFAAPAAFAVPGNNGTIED